MHPKDARSPTIAQLDMRIGKLVGQSARRSGAARIRRGDVLRLFRANPTTAKLATPTGRKVGLAARRIGAAAMRRKAAGNPTTARLVSQTGRKVGRRASRTTAAANTSLAALWQNQLTCTTARKVSRSGRPHGKMTRCLGAAAESTWLARSLLTLTRSLRRQLQEYRFIVRVQNQRPLKNQRSRPLKL